MPQPQIDNTAVKKPLHPEDYPDLIGPPRPRQTDTGFITTDYANPIQRAVQKYSSAYLNSNFANSPFMDVMRWVPGLHVVEKMLTGQPVSEEEQMSMMMPVKIKLPKINYTGFTPREDFTISVSPVATRSTGRTNYSLLERPSKISTAEKLGLPRGDRGNLSRYQKEALEDMDYLHNTDNLSPRIINGKVKYVNPGNNQNMDLFTHLKNNGAKVNEYAGAKIDLPEGFLTYNPNNNKILFSSKFNTPFGEATYFSLGNRDGKVILTSPKTEMLNKGLPAEGVSATIPKQVMKNFWTSLDTYVSPGTYVSGDQGRSPLGYSLWKLWKNRNTISKKLLNSGETQLIRNGDLNSFYRMLQTQPKVFARDEGLSTDSYMAILKQGNRPGHRLRFSSDGFNTFNNQGVENKWISDLLEASKRGEITQQEFLNKFNNWVAPYNGMPAVIRNGEISIPHPFILYKSGGKL